MDLVELFSSLYSMLPEAKSYLVNGGLSPSPAAYATIGPFLGGVLGIQVVSRIMHHYIPSHIVDCNHSHDDRDEHDRNTEDEDEDCHDHHAHSNGHTHRSNSMASENTALLNPSSPNYGCIDHHQPQKSSQDLCQKFSDPYASLPSSRRPSLQQRLTTRVVGIVSGGKVSCTTANKCGGYGEPCLTGCLGAKSRGPIGFLNQRTNTSVPSHLSTHQTSAAPYSRSLNGEFLEGLSEETNGEQNQHPSYANATTLRGRRSHPQNGHLRSIDQIPSFDVESSHQRGDSRLSKTDPESGQPDHHHHVPANAFLSIGLQTSIAIALHKLPEGFITYATNHASPKLGFSVFMALFIHNITEGFAMALPLYLALKSRPKAMLWSSLLGGVSQPLGAGIAAIWFKAAGSRGMAPGELVYGCMFAITSGVMASVALQLFQESMTMTHNRNMCTLFAFVGMGILGFSFALTAS